MPYPLLDAQAAEDIHELLGVMRDLTEALGASQVEARRDRVQREALALRG